MSTTFIYTASVILIVFLLLQLYYSDLICGHFKAAVSGPGLSLLSRSGLVFTKGLRLSQVLGLNPVLKLRLLSQLSFVLKPYSQRMT